MNNHRVYTEIENEIEYRVLEYKEDDKKDIVNIEKFVFKYENVKIIQLNYTYVTHTNSQYPSYNIPVPIDRITYYKNGKIHNIYGPAIVNKNQKGSLIFLEEYQKYFINGEKLTEGKWLARVRKYKIQKIEND